MSLPLRHTAIALLSSASLLTACSKPPPAEEPVRAVKVITVGVDAIQSGSDFAGEVQARVESKLGFRVPGKVIRRSVELGQRVRAGELLAQLDLQDYRLSADAARAQLTSAAANRDLAAADFKRYKELREQNFISGAELERRETTWKSAQAQFDQAQSQLSSQSNQATYTSLVADVSGVVTAVDVEPGQVVSAGNPAFRIAQDGPRDVVFSVPEDKIRLIHTGTNAEIRPWASGEVIQGTVREVAASADPVTRTFQVKLALDPKNELGLGTTVAVRPLALSRGEVRVIKLPTSALRRDGHHTAVWVLDTTTMTVNLRDVVVATADGNAAVISSGLEPGLKVVSAGVHVLSPGQKVSLYEDKYAASKAPANASAGPAGN
jgi:RND family efflux transporter MFP subunit